MSAHPPSSLRPPRCWDVFGVWGEIEPEAQPITRMIVTDSRTSDPVRPVFLTFDGDVERAVPLPT